MNDSQELTFVRHPWERVIIGKHFRVFYCVLSNGLEQRKYRLDCDTPEQAQEQFDKANIECLLRGFFLA